jgi:hypothetical protein
MTESVRFARGIGERNMEHRIQPAWARRTSGIHGTTADLESMRRLSPADRIPLLLVVLQRFGDLGAQAVGRLLNVVCRLGNNTAVFTTLFGVFQI